MYCHQYVCIYHRQGKPHCEKAKCNTILQTNVLLAVFSGDKTLYILSNFKVHIVVPAAAGSTYQLQPLTVDINMNMGVAVNAFWVHGSRLQGVYLHNKLPEAEFRNQSFKWYIWCITALTL